jgi:glycosyltransferase involved in cell wall biosynthesis
MTTVSVIIPCHNDEAYLAEALQSVLDQTLAPDEIVVIDDGSTDHSAEVAQGFGARIRLVSQENQGIGAARNRGVAASSGEIIAFLDADDLWPADSLASRLSRLAGEPRADCVFGLTQQFLSPDLDPETAAGLFCPPEASAARFAGAMLVRRAVFERVGPFKTDIKVGETIDWVSRLTDDGAPVATVPVLAMRRRIHGGNTVVKERASHGDYLRVLKAGLDRRAAAKGRT